MWKNYEEYLNDLKSKKMNFSEMARFIKENWVAIQKILPVSPITDRSIDLDKIKVAQSIPPGKNSEIQFTSMPKKENHVDFELNKPDLLTLLNSKGIK